MERAPGRDSCISRTYPSGSLSMNTLILSLSDSWGCFSISTPLAMSLSYQASASWTLMQIMTGLVSLALW